MCVYVCVCVCVYVCVVNASLVPGIGAVSHALNSMHDPFDKNQFIS